MSDDLLTLNVGGVQYTTTRNTLLRYPESMLGKMFDGNFVPSCKDKDGNHFIDRDGELFRYVLNFLRSGRLKLPHNFTDFELLENEADFYQIPALIDALQEFKKHSTDGAYLEILDFEETAYFYRFYSDPPKGINSDLKNGGLVISGSKEVLLSLPLPDKTHKEVEKTEAQYRSVNINSTTCPKMGLVHFLQSNGWQLEKSSFAYNSDSDGSYMVHKYIWFKSNLSS